MSDNRPPIPLPDIPDMPDGDSSGILMVLMPLIGGLGSVVMVVTMRPGPRGMLTGGLFFIALLTMAVMWWARSVSTRRREIWSARYQFFTQLNHARTLAQHTAHAQRSEAHTRFPSPRRWLLSDLAHHHLTFRADHWLPTDSSWSELRYGEATAQLAASFLTNDPQNSVTLRPDPLASSAMRAFLSTYRSVPALPAVLRLADTPLIRLLGPPSMTRAHLRALVISLARAHHPRHLRLALITTTANLAHWQWSKYLPHLHPGGMIGPTQLVFTTDQSVPSDLLDPPDGAAPPIQSPTPVSSPQWLFICDLPDTASPARAIQIMDALTTDATTLATQTPVKTPVTPWIMTNHATLATTNHSTSQTLEFTIDLTAASPTTQLRDPTDNHHHSLLHHPSHPLLPLDDLTVDDLTLDALTDGEATAAARHLSAFSASLSSTPNTQVTPPTLSITTALSTPCIPSSANTLTTLDRAICNLTQFPSAQHKPASHHLVIPLGTNPDNTVLRLDIKEFAHGGMGPHGLLIGATGSGKSELLRTLVLGLILGHHCSELNLVLIDFKGGATFTPFHRAPHLSALITNLSEDVTLVDRLTDAIAGEVSRRQELLRSAGPFPSRIDYERARTRTHRKLPPLPSLVIIVDEFSELLGERPDFADVFASLGRVGRSLGIHLLLASQRLEEGKLRGLESHISYRIAMRTFTELESRTVLGTADAYHLPVEPGHAYLQAGGTLRRFRATYISGPPPTPPANSSESPPLLPHIFPSYDVAPATTTDSSSLNASTAPSLLEMALSSLPADQPGAHRIWLPPLDHPEPLGSLLPASPTTAAPPTTLPVGITDLPRLQRRDITNIDLGPLSSHILIVGGPRSGKTTFLITCALAIAATTMPAHAQLYLIDAAGTLSDLRDLPHCASYARMSEAATIDTILDHLESLITARETPAENPAKPPAENPAPTPSLICLLIDGWSVIKRDLPHYEERLVAIAQRGLSCRIRVILTTSRALDLRSHLRDICAQVFEFKLTDPLDSLHDHKLAAAVPVATPGRGLNASGQHFHAAAPQLKPLTGQTGKNPAAAEPSPLTESIAHIARAHPSEATEKIAALPATITLTDLRQYLPRGVQQPIILGLEQGRRNIRTWDDHTHPLLVVLGAAKSGKTTFLTALIQQITARYLPSQAQLYVVDYRRTLRPAVTAAADHCDAHIHLPSELRNIFAAVLHSLRTRLATTAKPANATRAFLIIDDYQLAREDLAAHLSELTDLLPIAAEIGLRIIITAKLGQLLSVSDRLITHLWELGAPSIIFSTGSDRPMLPSPLRPLELPPGRAQYIDGDDAAIMQTPTLAGPHQPSSHPASQPAHGA